MNNILAGLLFVIVIGLFLLAPPIVVNFIARRELDEAPKIVIIWWMMIAIIFGLWVIGSIINQAI